MTNDKLIEDIERVVVYKDGYIRYVLKGGETVRAHRYIMEHHIGRKLNAFEHVHHIDGNRANNDISNLLLLTIGEHSRLHRKKEVTEGKPLFGNNNEFRKRKVIGTGKNGEAIEFESLQDARRNGFSHVVDCCKGARSTDKGYTWRYAE
jgi:hypothetical protein